MDSSSASDLIQHALVTAIVVGSPLLLVGMAAGLVIGLGQALTQIQDQTVAIVPKMFAVALIAILCTPWILQRLVEFTQEIIIGAGFIGQ